MKTLIYIISSPRSGSTLLANILGNSPSCFNVGEVSSLDGFIKEDSRQAKAFGYKCSCGSKFDECCFWSDVLNKASAKIGIGVKEISTSIKFKIKSPLRILFKKRYLKLIQDDLFKNSSTAKVADNVFTIFDNIVSKTGCSTIIDSSKKLTNLMAYIKHTPKDWRIKVVHISRDPEATALSVQKAGYRLNISKDQGFYLNLFKCVHYNSLIKTYLKKHNHLSISLNELCLDFEKFEEKIIGFIDLDSLKKLSLSSSMRERHDIGGSVSISKLGAEIKLNLDESWIKDFSHTKKLICKIIKSI